MGLQVKLFANGIKAVLKPETKNSQAVLKLFNKDGCLISQREIQNKTNEGTRVLEKLTLRANDKGEKSIETLRKDILAKGYSIEHREVGLCNFGEIPCVFKGKTKLKLPNRKPETYSYTCKGVPDTTMPLLNNAEAKNREILDTFDHMVEGKSKYIVTQKGESVINDVPLSKKPRVHKNGMLFPARSKEKLVKTFTNGVKAVYQPETINGHGILKLFDKDGCLIAQRITTHRFTKEKTAGILFGKKKIEKVTVKAVKDGEDYKGHIESLSLTKQVPETGAVEREYDAAISKDNWFDIDIDDRADYYTSELRKLYDSMGHQWYMKNTNGELVLRSNPKPMRNGGWNKTES